MEKKYELSRDVATEIFETTIVPYLFATAKPVANPNFFMVGGQPGSGKTALVSYSKEILNNNYISVDGDLLRRFHPSYAELFKNYGADASKYTHLDCARWSIWAIRKARELKYNVILENTLRDKNILQTIELFHQNGYEIKVKVMVVSELESALGLFQRYFDALSLSKSSGVAPRYSSKARHDETCNNLPNTIEAIQKQGLSNLEFYRRGTESIEKIAIPKNINSFKDFYLKSKDYPFTIEELKYIKEELFRIQNLLNNHISSRECVEDFKSLEEEVKNIIK
ncbi:MAG: zeta toxin family protein [Bacilli bacterium]|nr:zeta toxin family protein [Bacilli bacterium]